jgi:hypothetical protein
LSLPLRHTEHPFFTTRQSSLGAHRAEVMELWTRQM